MKLTGDSDVAKLRIIVGQTAAGKSALAMALSREFPLTIISADSRQIYRHFDIGTGKPTPAERKEVPHVGLDQCEPTERWSAPRWVDAVLPWTDGRHDPSRAPLVVGGTGLYVRALVDPIFAEPTLDPVRREQLAAYCARLSGAELAQWVAALDPALAHGGRTQQLRAVEVALLTGEQLSKLRRSAALPRRYAPSYLLLDIEEESSRIIADRIDHMLEMGWLAECEQLTNRVPDDAPAWKACGYRELRRLVRGATTLAKARQEILVATRQYAKRQRTWFRHQLTSGPVVRLNPRSAGALDRALQWWRNPETA